VKVYPNEGYYDPYWLTGLWSIQAKAESIVLKAAWQWGNDSGVLNDRFVEPGRTPLCVGLPTRWGSVDGDPMFFPFSRRGSLTGD